IDRRRECPAGHAPVRPEINQHGLSGLENLVLECVIGKRLRLSTGHRFSSQILRRKSNEADSRWLPRHVNSTRRLNGPSPFARSLAGGPELWIEHVTRVAGPLAGIRIGTQVSPPPLVRQTVFYGHPPLITHATNGAISSPLSVWSPFM